MSSGYEDEIEKTPPKKIKRTISKKRSKEELRDDEENDEAPKKLTVKMMVHEALVDLKSRKGTSLYAIKKYMKENYDVDLAKVNYIIKKIIKNEVEAGIIVQVNGVGVTGSFKLAPDADKTKKKSKTKKKKDNVEEDIVEKPDDKTKKIKTTKSDTKTKKIIKNITNVKKVKKADGVKRKLELVEDSDEGKVVKPKSTRQTKTKNMEIPLKKRAAMSKRKSIGSIIRPPKMKPKA